MTNEDNPKLIPGLAEGFDLRYGLKVLWSGKTTLIAVTLVALAMGYLMTSMQTPLYKAHAVVQIEPPKQNLNALSNPYPATAFNWFDHQNYYKKNPEDYRRYRLGSGRDAYLEKVWGKKSK